MKTNGPVKRGRRRTNMGTQEVAKVIDSAKRYSEISARLKGVEQALQQMSRKLNNM